VRSDPSTYRRLADRRVSSWCTNGGALSEPPFLGHTLRLVGKFGFDPLKQLPLALLRAWRRSPALPPRRLSSQSPSPPRSVSRQAFNLASGQFKLGDA